MKEISNRLDLEIKDKEGKIVKCYIDLDLLKRDEEFFSKLDGSYKNINRTRYNSNSNGDSTELSTTR